MRTLATAAALLLAGTAHAQTPPAATTPAAPASAVTRDLNSGPPAPAVYLTPVPAPIVGTEPSASSAPAAPAAPAVRPVVPASAAPIARPAPRPASGVPVAPPARTVASPSVVAPALPPAPVPATPEPPAVPTVTVLDSAARAALPFRVDLPAGFELVTGRPGPDFRIYTIRRGTQSFVMVYTGPASQFPIYSGQLAEAAGRTSVLSEADGVRRAVEHLFQRTTAPGEIHIWTMSLDGADRDLAEQIAQSVDVR